MRIYLAGPMRGMPNHNFPAFNAAAKRLREQGHEIFNPAEKEIESFSGVNVEVRAEDIEFKRKVFSLDTNAICTWAEAVALLPLWGRSAGATAEKALAHAIGLHVFMLDDKGDFIGDAPAHPGHKAVDWARAAGVQIPIGFSGTFMTPDGPIPYKDGAPVCAAPTAGPPPNRLPISAETRKGLPMARGLLDYFPDALAYVAMISDAGNKQHNPGEELHWARDKSTDHADCIMRHLVDRGGLDGKHRHSGKLAWRALALLQVELETATGLPPPRGAR